MTSIEKDAEDDDRNVTVLESVISVESVKRRGGGHYVPRLPQQNTSIKHEIPADILVFDGYRLARTSNRIAPVSVYDIVRCLVVTSRGRAQGQGDPH